MPPSTTVAAIVQASTARASIEVAIAARRPCGSRSSSGPMTGASSANGAMVISRYSATRPRASPVGTEKKMVEASATVISMSPNEFSACSSISFARPDSPAPSAEVARRIRRPVPCTTRPVRRPTAEAPRIRTLREPWSSASVSTGLVSTGLVAPGSVSGAGAGDPSTGCGSSPSAGWTEGCCRDTAPGSSGLPACGACSACCDGFSSATQAILPEKPDRNTELGPARRGPRVGRGRAPGPGLSPGADRRVACPVRHRPPSPHGRRGRPGGNRAGRAARSVTRGACGRAEWTRNRAATKTGKMP